MTHPDKSSSLAGVAPPHHTPRLHGQLVHSLREEDKSYARVYVQYIYDHDKMIQIKVKLDSYQLSKEGGLCIATQSRTASRCGPTCAHR